MDILYSARQVVMIILLLFSCLDGQFCDEFFPSLEQIRAANISGLVFLPSSDVDFREWIFPNSFRCACQGNVTGWIFRSDEGISDFSDRELPQWSIYEDSAINPTVFNLLRVSGSAGEIREIEPGLYQYTLDTPVSVKFGDILGVRYEQSGPPFLRIGFRDLGAGSRPVSFRRPRLGSFIFDSNTTFVTHDTQYLPLVTVVVAGESLPYCFSIM